VAKALRLAHDESYGLAEILFAVKDRV
jgi:hypothetical protein